MPYAAKEIANWFLAEARDEGEFMTQMKLQKLVYIAHGWNLGLGGGPLIRENVQAWQYGPVIRELYAEYLHYGAMPITEEPERPSLDQRDTELLRWVWGQYKGYTAGQLSSITHKPGTPWTRTYVEGVKENISEEIIRAHYETLVTTWESASVTSE
jgi:uncharacterized phage-associated protein